LLVNEIVSPSVESTVPSILTVQVLCEFTDTEVGEHETSVVGVTRCPSMLPEPVIVPLLLIVPALLMTPVLLMIPALTMTSSLSTEPMLFIVEPAWLKKYAVLTSVIWPPSLLLRSPEPSLTSVPELTSIFPPLLLNVPPLLPTVPPISVTMVPNQLLTTPPNPVVMLAYSFTVMLPLFWIVPLSETTRPSGTVTITPLGIVAVQPAGRVFGNGAAGVGLHSKGSFQFPVPVAAYAH